VGSLSTEAETAGYLLLKRGFWLSLSIASSFPSSGTCQPWPALGNSLLHDRVKNMKD